MGLAILSRRSPCNLFVEIVDERDPTVASTLIDNGEHPIDTGLDIRAGLKNLNRTTSGVSA